MKVNTGKGRQVANNVSFDCWPPRVHHNKSTASDQRPMRTRIPVMYRLICVWVYLNRASEADVGLFLHAPLHGKCPKCLRPRPQRLTVQSHRLKMFPNSNMSLDNFVHWQLWPLGLPR